jgi:hypothetical protein
LSRNDFKLQGAVSKQDYARLTLLESPEHGLSGKRLWRREH